MVKVPQTPSWVESEKGWVSLSQSQVGAGSGMMHFGVLIPTGTDPQLTKSQLLIHSEFQLGTNKG